MRQIDILAAGKEVLYSIIRDTIDRRTDDMKKLVITLGVAVLVAFLFRPLYMNDMQCNWLLLWILIGIPFGFRRMLLLVPRGYDLAGTVGYIAFSILIGGIIGGFCFIFTIIGGIIETARKLLVRY